MVKRCSYDDMIWTFSIGDEANLSFCIMDFKSSRILKILRFLNSSIMSFDELIQFLAILK